VIKRVHGENYGVYGVRKVHAELNRQGHRVARCTVARLMRAAGLRGISRPKGPRTTIPGAGPDARPDLLDRHFVAPAPDRVWVADITHCRTFAGWVYAAFVVDVFSRRVSRGTISDALVSTTPAAQHQDLLRAAAGAFGSSPARSPCRADPDPPIRRRGRTG